MSETPVIDLFFTPFEGSLEGYSVPERFIYSDDESPHLLCLLAANQLQNHLTNQQEWDHNFGLSEVNTDSTVIGKMFGVLVVKTHQNQIGYLSAFSGKLAGSNHHSMFVPPVFDSLTDQSFVNIGMTELTRINKEIRNLEEVKPDGYIESISLLKTQRKEHSNSLQKEIFNNYHFLNQAGEKKSLYSIFNDASYKNPPSGAGECAGPKLLQYAFIKNMKPLALAEFWWGQSPKSNFWKHGHFYPCCSEKCEPILAHMLAGII